MITIKEIAEQLGMSTTTISNVIHGKTGEVSGETTERVRKFLEEVEYVPNISARNLPQNRSKIIGVVLKAWENKYDNIFQDPFVSEMIGGIVKQIRENGYFMMLYISDDIAEILKHVSTWNVDGLILFCMLDDDALRVRRKYHKPIVCIDTYVDHDADGAEEDEFVNIGLDDEQGAYDATRYLIEKGHRKIGFIGGSVGGAPLKKSRRYRSYLETMADLGLEVRPEWVLNCEWDDQRCIRLVEQVYREHELPTAFYAASDLMAMAALRALYQLGVPVPGRVAVIGMSNIEMSQYANPPLTTIDVPAVEMGITAARVIAQRIRGDDSLPKRILLPSTLIERDSV